MSDSTLAPNSREALLQILKQENTPEAKLQAIRQMKELPVQMDLIQDFLQILRQPYPEKVLLEALSFISKLAPLKDYPNLKIEILDTLGHLSKNSEGAVHQACQKTIHRYPLEGESISILKIVLLVIAIFLGIAFLLVSACFYLLMSGPH